jgi:hypothetical protein
MNRLETTAEADSLATTASAAFEETESVRRKISTARLRHADNSVFAAPQWVAESGGEGPRAEPHSALHMSRFEVPQ